MSEQAQSTKIKTERNQMENLETLTSEQITELMSAKPELLQGAVSSALAAIDAKIAHYTSLRASIAGPSADVVAAAPATPAAVAPKKRGPKPKKEKTSTADTSANKLKHAEAVMKVLSLSEFKGGANSRQIREAAEKRYSHVFGSSLGTTLNKMCEEKSVKAKPRGKDSKQFNYSV
jgi:uncharacterized membrane protein